MIRSVKGFFVLITVLAFLQCGTDPIILFPKFSDPSFITRTNYDFNGNISSARDRAAGIISSQITDVPDPSFITRTNYIFDGFIQMARLEASFLSPGTPLSALYVTTVAGIVLNNYDASTSGTYNNGFFIQDINAAIFVSNASSTSGVVVQRGDKVAITVTKYYKSSAGQLQVYKPAAGDITIISSGNLIYCVDINSPTSSTNPSGGPRFVKMSGFVSTKGSSTAATWGLDSDSWAIRIPVTSERDFPNINPGDEVIGFGVVDWYSGSMTSAVSNRYVLWAYSTTDSIYSATTGGDIVEGIVLNDYNASISGTYFNGFFIQDENAAIFVRNTDSTSGIAVQRGDRVRITVGSYRNSSTTGAGQLQIDKPPLNDITIISTGHKIYCIDIDPYTSSTNPAGGPHFVRITGHVSDKSTDDPATWGMNGNSWGIRIPVQYERNFPDVLPGDKIVSFGIVDWYDQSLAGGDVLNQYALWIYNTADSIYDFSTK